MPMEGKNETKSVLIIRTTNDHPALGWLHFNLGYHFLADA